MLNQGLTVIIPTLNEAEALPLLLADLARQKGLAFAVVVTDGGSVDSTCQFAEDFFSTSSLSGVCLKGQRGRGRQLNAGASIARTEWLLFLHADSRLTGEHQLQQALDFLRRHQRNAASDASAGRFALRFDAPAEEDRFGLFFYEAKACLGRSGCIHGDQGLLLTREFFYRVGPFREDLPVMEDTSLAEAIRAAGQWLLLPGELLTSARRFQTEGLKSRQTLNALMMNFLAIGWLDFFVRAPDIYRQQDRTRPLQLLPFFCLIRTLFAEMSLRKRLDIWLATGEYVRSQAWQIGVALDCRKAYQSESVPELAAGFWLNWFDRWFEPLTNHWPGRVLTAFLVRVWYAWQFRRKAEHSA